MDKNGWRQADPYTRIIAAMWHRNRKDFAEWTGAEIDRRADVNDGFRREAVKRKLIARSRCHGGHHAGEESTTIYSVTDLGRKLWEEQNGTGNPSGYHPARRRLVATPLPNAHPRGNPGSRR